MGSQNSKYIGYHKIENYLYLGDWDTALDHKLLKDLNIDLVLNVASDPIPDIYRDETIVYKYIYSRDNKHWDLLCEFNDCFDYIINGQMNGQNVFVHCYAGVSRSAAIVIAFLMKKYRISYHLAKDLVKKKRSVINPNKGFVKQLKLYEEMDWDLNANNRRFRKYLFKKTMVGHKKYDYLIDMESYLAKMSYAESRTHNISYGQIFECNECGFQLFSEINLIQNWIPKYLRIKTKECNELFIEPKHWMNVFDSDQRYGQVECPECFQVIGYYELPFKRSVHSLCILHNGLKYIGFRIKRNKVKVSKQ